jgi:hypothetical protein
VLRLKQSVLLSSLAVFALLPLGSCSNTPWADTLQRSLAADPRLETNPVTIGASPTPTAASPTVAQLPTDFPGEIPRYPNAELVGVTQDQAADFSSGANPSTQTRWATVDQAEQVQQFYKDKFQADGWQLAGSGVDAGSIVAERDGLEVTVAVAPSASPATPSPAASTVGSKTEFSIAYQFSNSNNSSNLPIPAESPTQSPTQTAQSNSSSAPVPQPGDPDFIGPVLPSQSTAQQNSGSAQPASAASQAFTDLDKAPTQLQSYITDLAKLGVLQLKTGQADGMNNSSGASSSGGEFKPNDSLTRRGYARWLFAANNALYANQPARQIRLGTASDQIAFQDVPATDPDFGMIQGLANAGLLPSPLSGDSTTVTFRPDAPLTREDLVLWKVPVDTRRALPNASIESVQQTWGFQDAARIDPKALRAVLQDFQNGDLSNIRRSFGYTTLFQPKKPVTRAEAAAALWYFGFQGDGISAKDALQSNAKPASQAP